MITKSDLDHHIRRERFHREAALKATDPGARMSHVEMAESHARRIGIAEAALNLEIGTAKATSALKEGKTQQQF